jgi:galactitol-specific phosphotransferase system IIB component
MPRSFVVAASLIICTACGGGSGSSLYVSQVTPTPASPDNVFDCSRTTLDSMKYRSISLDLNDRQTTARHSRPDITVADPTFYQAFDAIDVAVNVSGTGQTDLELTGHTYFEYRTNVGPYQAERPADDSVKVAVATLAAKCATK